MIYKYVRSTAALLIAAMLISALYGCSLIPDDGEDPITDFTAPYIDNYYVNKHDPVCVSGNMTVYKYNSPDATLLTMGGHDYRGGFVIEKEWSSAELGCVELPLGGQYENISFVIGGNYSIKKVALNEKGEDIYQSDHTYSGSYPTLTGQETETRAAVQFLIDGKIADEILISGYDVEKRYTFNISGAESFSFKIMADTGLGGIPVMELTVWEGEAHETGYVSQPVKDKAIKLIRDLKPYLIPSSSNSLYYPSYTGGNTTVFMANTEYTDVLTSRLSSDLLDEENEEIYFNLEGHYGYLTFTAGAADGIDSSYDSSAWLTVYADGKKVFEELFSAGELQKTFTVEIPGCRQLKFVWSSNTAGEFFADTKTSVYAIADAYVAVSQEILSSVQLSEGNFPSRPIKVISELGVFAIESEAPRSVFDGSDKKSTFRMAGRQYSEGVLLLSSNTLLLGDTPASASFILGGKYKTVSFIAGHIENLGIYKNEKIRVFADGVMIKEIDVSCTDLPFEYSVDVSGCRLLEFVSGLEHATSMQRPTLGIANLAAYPGAKDENDLFIDKNGAAFPDKADLIKLFGFYDVRNPSSDIKIGGVINKDGYFDGSGKNSFRLDNKIYDKGLILHTNVDPSPDMNSIIGSGLMGSAIAMPGLSIVSLSAKGEARESAFAASNISGGGYTTLSFTASFLKTKANAEDETVLMIFADGKCIKELVLSKDMDTRSYTIDISSAERLVFWLSCSDGGAPSHYYAIYDITLSK